MDRKALIKLLASDTIGDTTIGLEILSKQKSLYVKSIVREINKGCLRSAAEVDHCTYSIDSNCKGEGDIYITKGNYYCAIYNFKIYIDSPERAKKRIKNGDSKLLEQ